ncbi:glycosyltransferase family 4 protein [Paenibacillus sp. 7124]|uniref:Glycosyltransferase family 4 protein n=1 Tax=Paenibacillus apii TaxID=1850370 RepID=A0A6M1PK59_9BACL|nr:glycosyltransferase family 4 protein [Paenibacillus apii]NGM83576.1 glycosyltransferase family 4 protein [Paenibacillus apii]
MLKHKRGVENVILFQSKFIEADNKYFIFFDDETSNYFYEGLNCIGIQKNFARFFQLNKVVKEINTRHNKVIVHSHNYLMSFFLFFKTDIFTVHDGLYYLSSERNHKYKNLFKLIEMYVYTRSKKVHFISKYAKSKALYNQKLQKEIIIYNTTPLESKDYVEKNLVFSKDKINLFTVRSIEERARIDLLIELAQRNKNTINIYVAGKGPLLEYYESKIELLGLENISMLGYIDDKLLMNYYKKCDMVILLAEFGEGFGLPIIEGYLYNKKVIASNICAIPEVIINKKYLFENNIHSLENKIYEASKDDSNQFSRYYFNTFSLNAIGSKYMNLYNEIFNNFND